MPYTSIVLAKQVPDTANITGEAMKEDGTVNRTALSMIFNPEDLNALELALEIKAEHGGRVILVSMGLPSACNLLRDGLYRGVDQAVLITDRRAAASDTLATSFILSCAVKKLAPYDMVICGRQAIDGDTAQVGPQAAEKLGLPQITYLERLESLSGKTIRVRRNVGNGFEIVEGDLPMLLTVMDTANEPRPPAMRRVMKYKRARALVEIQGELKKAMPDAEPDAIEAEAAKRAAALQEQGLLITQWNLDDVEADLNWCGRNGSPTKVNRIQSIVLTGSEFKSVEPTDQGIADMVHGLIEDHTIG